MASRDAVKLTGGRELRHLMGELPRRVRTKGLRAGVTAAAAPIVKQTKATVKRQSGLLKKAITRKIKTYRGGNVVVSVIGANRNVSGDYKGRKRVPANYFHLVEGGHDSVPGDHALQHAYDANKQKAGQVMVDKMQSVLEAEAAKLAKV